MADSQSRRIGAELSTPLNRIKEEFDVRPGPVRTSVAVLEMFGRCALCVVGLVKLIQWVGHDCEVLCWTSPVDGLNCRWNTER